jgi:NAD(P)H-quinone oxidoreductase subunit 5
MHLNFISLFALLPPASFVATAIASWLQPGLRPGSVKFMGVSSALISIVVAAISGLFVMQHGLLESATIGVSGLGISIRLDPISMLMSSMIAILGFIVVRFSLNYLDGDARQGRFIGRLATTIASVQLLVLSGNIGLLLISWILTSMSLHRLLIFYSDRPGAVIAARKKFIVARLGDACLLAAILLLYFELGTGNLEIIFQRMRDSVSAETLPITIEVGAVLLAFAAMLKSAQFPTHGWLVEVMETPTPVSALLHAGLLNAGPFLLIRMAHVMEAGSYAAPLIVVVGGFTALFASLAFLTQTSVKTALGYSSVAHMGFSLMVCGLGAYSAAMLHLVAHSFYKAHAFLSSGSVIDTIRASKIQSSKRTGSPIRIAAGMALALGTYVAVALLWGLDPSGDLSLLAVGGIIVMGLTTIFTSALDSSGNNTLLLRAGGLAVTVSAAFFTLESATHHVLASQLPALTEPDFTQILLTTVVLITFGTVVFLQILAPGLPSKPVYRAIAIHMKNGLYANAIFDRIVGALAVHSSATNVKIADEPVLAQRQDVVGINLFENQPA